MASEIAICVYSNACTVEEIKSGQAICRLHQILDGDSAERVTTYAEGLFGGVDGPAIMVRRTTELSDDSFFVDAVAADMDNPHTYEIIGVKS